MICATHNPRAEAGFTLLEVILALAILAGSVAVLGEVMSIAGRHAHDAHAETRAQLLACSLMDEIVAGITEAADQNRVPLEIDDTSPWVASITIGTTHLEELMSIEVVVEQDLEKPFHPIRYRLIRWIPSQGQSTNTASQSGGGNSGA